MKIVLAAALLLATPALAYNGAPPVRSGWHEAICWAPTYPYHCWVKPIPELRDVR